MQVDAVHVNVSQERQGSGSAPRLDKGKGGKGGKGKFKKGGKGKEKYENPVSKFEGECRYCQKKGTQEGGVQKDESGSRCRQVRQAWQANLCQVAHSDRCDAAFSASELCAESGEHHRAAADGPSALPESHWQSALRNLVHQHDRAGPVDSHGCKLGRSRIRVVGFWIWLDILPIQLC